MKLSPKQAIERADITLDDLASNGGLLNEEQANRFIDFVYEAPTLLKEVRQVKMNSHTTKIEKIGFGQRILRPSPGSGQELAANDRVKPTTDKIEINTEEVVGEVWLPYEVLEDNIEEANLEETIMRNIALRTAVDLEELAIQGDTGSRGMVPGVWFRSPRKKDGVPESISRQKSVPVPIISEIGGIV